MSIRQRDGHCRDERGFAKPVAIALLAAVLAAVAAGAGLWRTAVPSAPRLATIRPAVSGLGFTSGTSGAFKFGTHEVSLSGNGAVTNPFDVRATVTFTPPSGAAAAKTVDAFYDGGNTWRARVFLTETGTWTWTATSPDDPLLNTGGAFTCQDSKLRGRLVRHPSNPRAWATEDGRWFGQVGDTAYKLLHDSDAPLWQQYVADAAAHGVNTLRAGSLGAFDEAIATHDDWWRNDPWPGGDSPDYQRFDLLKFQTTDTRLEWILNNHPGMYVQMILFGLKGYGGQGTGDWWAGIDPAVRERTMRYMIARWSAFPNVYWLVVNDMNSGAEFPLNLAFAREAGRFFAAHEPWPHLLSSGPVRYEGFPFAGPQDRDWVSYAHIEDMDAVGADELRDLGLQDAPLHVYMAEDRYEQDYDRYVDPDFFFRWLNWSWLLAGGSANYGGRFGVIHPYAQTARTDLQWTGLGGIDFTGEALHGLDACGFVSGYFAARGIDLGLFTPDDALVADVDGRSGQLRPKAARRGHEELIAYHPNASSHGQEAAVDGRTARLRVDLREFPGRFAVEWYRPPDGSAMRGAVVTGGSLVEFSSPWANSDVVLRLTPEGKRVRRERARR